MPSGFVRSDKAKHMFRKLPSQRDALLPSSTPDASFLKNLKAPPLSERLASINQSAEYVKNGLLDNSGPPLSSNGIEATSSLCLSPCLVPTSCAPKPGIDSKSLPSELQNASWADVVQSVEPVASISSLNYGVALGGLENQSDTGVHAGVGKALPENLGSAIEHPPDQSIGIGQESPTEATENNQWGIMPPADFAEEFHQLFVPDHVVGLLELKLNDMESPFPPNNLFSVLQDPMDSNEQEECVDPVGRTVINVQPSPQASEISLPAFACFSYDPKIVGQQCCNVEEVSRPAKRSLTVSFAEKLQEGIDPVDSRFPSICSAPVPISDEDRLAALGSSTCSAVGDGSQAGGFAPSFHSASAIPEVATNMMEPISPVCAVATMDVVCSGLPTVAESVDDPAAVSAYSLHDAQFGHHDMAPVLVDDLDLTPNSITRLSSKYSLDTLSNVEHDTISLEGSLAGVCEGRALDASRVKFHRAIDVTAMQYGPWQQTKSRR
ncbi:hypothetical protein Nepgr_023172 [Nepenthes gracilis]|uniref:Uncharacterized protein n=1 Tax=Nepenthes gracilis TaxID=150966 RepID=A0AAD3XYV3_NEPGR|nr:hypothetical protein Nepgr_023172 [Nepenthes gracilis]